MVLSIVISKEHMSLLIEESKRSEEEFGALLFGKIDENKAVVHSIKLLQYSERSPTHFRADSIFLLNSFSEAEKKCLELVGIFHSHPAPPKPSVSDLRFMRLNRVVWMIVDNRDFKLGAYVLKDDGLIEVRIKVVGNFS